MSIIDNHYAFFNNVLEEDIRKNILDYAETVTNDDTWIDCSYQDWHALQDTAWAVYEKVFHKLLAICDNPLNPYLDDFNSWNSFFRIQLKRVKPGFVRNNIHRDSDWKQMAVVIYLSNEGEGTKLYKTNDPSSYFHTVPFIPNTGIAHIPSETSWHDYDHNNKFTSDRITLMFLMADKRFYK